MFPPCGRDGTKGRHGHGQGHWHGHGGVWRVTGGAPRGRGDVRVFLVNTGWCGGYAGEVPRIKLSLTRSLVKAAIGGALDDAEYERDELFHLNVPSSCPGIPDGVLSPQTYWADNDRYLREREHLASLFEASSK